MSKEVKEIDEEMAGVLEEMSSDDQMEVTTLPTIKLEMVKKRGKEVASFVCDEYGIERQSLDVVIVEKPDDTQRVLFPSEYAKNNKPLCQAVNGQVVNRHPDPEGFEGNEYVPTAERCADCEYSSWDNGSPPCKELIIFKLVILDDEFENIPLPALFTAKSTNYGTFKNLCNKLAIRLQVASMKNKKQGKPPAVLANFKIKLIAGIKQNAKGDSAVLDDFEITELPLDRDLIDTAIAMRETNIAIEHQEEEPTDEAPF